ncbi:unnamed protein product [Trichogramma brassicae]|uniref:Uncharacterized protein n=1 Tax=Trichogramma brassicae TaxID=86971 RepID=A0A6H5HWC5_9HYME|nr:unnamed protein product [Trichogramma brassicae]
MSRLECPQANARPHISPLPGARRGKGIGSVSARCGRAGPPCGCRVERGAYTGRRYLGGTQKELSRGSRSAPRPARGWHIPNSALKIAIAARPDIFLRGVYDVSGDRRFPVLAVSARDSSLLPKPGKPPDEPSSYRPLCMLDTAGKILERIICDRLEAFTERPEASRTDSMASGKGDQRLDAIEDVISTAREAIAGKRYTTAAPRSTAPVVTLDVRNAFNSARWDTTSPLYAICSYPITC